MITDLPVQLQGEGTITWNELAPLFTPAQKASLARYWYLYGADRTAAVQVGQQKQDDEEDGEGEQSASFQDISGDSEFDIEVVKAFFLHRRLAPE